MKKKPYKNYAFLTLIIVFTVLITMYLSYMYENTTKYTSNIYKYLDVITFKDFDEYVTENPDTMIYLADKNDETFAEFEEELINLIEEKNIRYDIVYIDASTKIINKINGKFKLNLKIGSIPYILFVGNGKIVDYKSIDENSNVKSIIQSEDLKW